MPDYSSVYPWIAKCLQDSARTVENDYFDLYIASEIRDRLPSPLVYADLTDPDKGRFNEAIGHLVAARTRAPLATGGAGKELTTEKTETTSRGFSGGALLDDEWRAHAKALLAACSFAPPEGTLAAGSVPVSFYAVNGPSRARDAARGRR